MKRNDATMGRVGSGRSFLWVGSGL